MTHANDEDGNRVEYDYDSNRWIYPNEPEYESINGKKKRICPCCHKPSVDMNGVCDVDFCLQGLSVCDFISNACCGHDNPENAYIGLADGRIFRLDKEWIRKL